MNGTKNEDLGPWFGYFLTFLPIAAPWAFLKDPTLLAWQIALVLPFAAVCNLLGLFLIYREQGKSKLWVNLVSFFVQVLLWYLYVRSLNP